MRQYKEVYKEASNFTWLLMIKIWKGLHVVGLFTPGNSNCHYANSAMLRSWVIEEMGQILKTDPLPLTYIWEYKCFSFTGIEHLNERSRKEILHNR